METKRKNLKEAMDEVVVTPNIITAMNELAYTACETELIPFKFHDDADLEAMVKLVRLAEKFKAGVPNNLRM